MKPLSTCYSEEYNDKESRLSSPEKGRKARFFAKKARLPLLFVQ